VKILIVNSNTSGSVTRTVEAEARRCASPGTDITAVTASFGPRSIESRSEAVIAAHATLDAFAEHGNDADAGIIACFSDPGLAAAKELMPFPVVGIAEAAIMSACMLAGRFSIVTVAPRTVQPIRELVAGYGLATRLASVRALERSVLAAHADQDGTIEAFRHLIERTATEDGAELAILGGAVTAGMTRTLAGGSPIPVLDGVGCAVRQVQALACAGAGKARTGSFCPPLEKEMTGVGPALTTLFSKNGNAN
jgi:allantoin racemase